MGIVSFDGQIEIESLWLFGLQEATPTLLYACLSVPVGAQESRWRSPGTCRLWRAGRRR